MLQEITGPAQRPIGTQLERKRVRVDQIQLATRRRRNSCPAITNNLHALIVDSAMCALPHIRRPVSSGFEQAAAHCSPKQIQDDCAERRRLCDASGSLSALELDREVSDKANSVSSMELLCRSLPLPRCVSCPLLVVERESRGCLGFLPWSVDSLQHRCGCASAWVENETSAAGNVRITSEHFGFEYLTAMRVSAAETPTIDGNGNFICNVGGIRCSIVPSEETETW
jgi:hypothetical protein